MSKILIIQFFDLFTYVQNHKIQTIIFINKSMKVNKHKFNFYYFILFPFIVIEFKVLDKLSNDWLNA